MLEKTTVRGKSKKFVFFRQNSRQGMKLGSHQVSCGKWHLKSLILAIIILTVFLFYIHMSDEHPGVRAQKRVLVVRPAKPYKSPLSRRRHPKPHTDGKGIQPPANASLTLNKHGADVKHNKSKVIPQQQPMINSNRGALNNALQFRDKYTKVHKGKVHPSSPPFFQVTPVKNLRLGPFKASGVRGNKKPVPYISPGGGKSLPNNKTSQQNGYNVHGFKVGALLQSTKTSTLLRYQKNNNGSFHILKPLVPNEVHADAKNQPADSVHDKNVVFPRPAVIPRPVIKMRSSLP